MTTYRKSCLERGNECPWYDRKLQRCKQGLVHPKGRLDEAVNAALQGLLKPCPWTPRGQKVIKLAQDEILEKP